MVLAASMLQLNLIPPKYWHSSTSIQSIVTNLNFKHRTFETEVAWAGRNLFKCPLLLSVPLKSASTNGV
jgi:hypothetical protein